MKVEEDGEDSAPSHEEIQKLMKKDGRNHGGDEGFDEGMEWNDEDGGVIERGNVLFAREQVGAEVAVVFLFGGFRRSVARGK